MLPALFRAVGRLSLAVAILLALGCNSPTRVPPAGPILPLSPPAAPPSQASLELVADLPWSAEGLWPHKNVAAFKTGLESDIISWERPELQVSETGALWALLRGRALHVEGALRAIDLGALGFPWRKTCQAALGDQMLLVARTREGAADLALIDDRGEVHRRFTLALPSMPAKVGWQSLQRDADGTLYLASSASADFATPDFLGLWSFDLERGVATEVAVPHHSVMANRVWVRSGTVHFVDCRSGACDWVSFDPRRGRQVIDDSSVAALKRCDSEALPFLFWALGPLDGGGVLVRDHPSLVWVGADGKEARRLAFHEAREPGILLLDVGGAALRIPRRFTGYGLSESDRGYTPASPPFGPLAFAPGSAQPLRDGTVLVSGADRDGAFIVRLRVRQSGTGPVNLR